MPSLRHSYRPRALLIAMAVTLTQTEARMAMTAHNSGKELALLCGRMFPEESDNIEKYVGGLSDMIHGSVMVSKPKTMQDAIEFATELID
ncbi:hypothetical protein Tco_0191066 [Tanacetum coccineum]